MRKRRREFLGAFAVAAVGSAGCTTDSSVSSGERTTDERERTTDEGERTTDDCEPPERSGDLTLLGNFETGLDGWRTNGENELSRISREDVPRGVVSGEHALAVEVHGDEVPTIENEDRATQADFANNPYLQLHVLAVDTETDSTLAFRFRLYHGEICGDGSGGGGSSESGDANVEESGEIVVPQLYPRRIQWDMTGLSDEVLATANRLEIVWRPADGEPPDDQSRTDAGEVGIRGLVVFDDVRLSGSEPISDAERLQRKKMDLRREHGMIADRVIEEQTETVERGTIEYADGFTVRYTYEALDGGGYEYTIDGETFRIERESS